MSSVPSPGFAPHDMLEHLHLEPADDQVAILAPPQPHFLSSILRTNFTWKSVLTAIAAATGLYLIINRYKMSRPKLQADPKTLPKISYGPTSNAKLKTRTGPVTDAQLRQRAKMAAVPSRNDQTVVTELRMYPIKSCLPITVDSFACGDLGPELPTEFGTVRDRGWMVMTKNKIFLTLRRKPRMCFIQPSIEGRHLVISAPGMEQLRVPIEVRLKDVPSADIFTVSVWGTDIQAVDCGDAAGEWFSRFLEDSGLRLVYHPVELGGRLCMNDTGIELWNEGHDKAAFQDLAPYLMLSQESIDDLNTHSGLQAPVPWTNFRPNVLFSGCPPYDEDTWENFQLGTAEFRMTKLCTRCIVTTVDTQTGKFRPDVLEVLRSYRCNQTPEWQSTFEDHPLVAVNVAGKKHGRVAVGDKVRHLSPSS